MGMLLYNEFTTDPHTTVGSDLLERFPLGTRVRFKIGDPNFCTHKFEWVEGTGAVVGVCEEVYDSGGPESGPKVSVSCALAILPERSTDTVFGPLQIVYGSPDDAYDEVQIA